MRKLLASDCLLLVGAALSAAGCSSRDFSVADVPAAAVAPPRIELICPTGEAPTIDVLGLDARELAAFGHLALGEQSAVLRVFVVGELADPPAILGQLSVVDERLRFTPRYPLAGGMRLRAVLDRTHLATAEQRVPAVATELKVPQPPAAAPTEITQVYPTAEALPENQLKFYLHFSAPMGRGDAYQHLHLLDSSGKEVTAAFLELGEELWDRDHLRFTLLCDPGRVKRGLRPREELGPVLSAGKTYTLWIDRDWLDAAGAPLAAEFRKTFRVLSSDDRPIDPADWKIDAPQALARDPLVVHFGEPLDHALAERVLRVVDGAGEKLAGTIELTDHETCWRFTPDVPWQAGEHRLVAETTLEDLAGNAIGRPFDVDVFGPIQKKIETQTVSIPFEIAPRAKH